MFWLSLTASLNVLASVSHTLSIERIASSACCIWRCTCEGSWFGNETKICVHAGQLSELQLWLMQPSPAWARHHSWAPLQPLLCWRQLTHMSSAVSEPATKTGRQQQLGIAGLKYDLKFNFFFFSLLAKLLNIILLVLKLLFLIWRAIKLYFVLRSSMNRSCWGRWVLVHRLY